MNRKNRGKGTWNRENDEQHVKHPTLPGTLLGMEKIIPRLLVRVMALATFMGSNGWAADTEPPPPPGRLYDVGGHKMHLYATGNGAGGPSVVLEAGAGAFSIDWYLVQQEVAKFATVCSYDRAGHAWSELGPRPRTMKQAVYDLHRLLVVAGMRGPYVMVGHSLGGALVRVFAAEYPKDVAGVVLVDAGVDNRPNFVNGKWEGPFDRAIPRQIPLPRDQIRDDERVLTQPELNGFKQFRDAFGPPKIESPFDKLPEPMQKLRLWAMSLPQSNVTDYNPYASEESLLLFAERIRVEHPLGNKPLVVLTRKSGDNRTTEEQESEKRRIEGQKSFRDLSSNSAFAMSNFPVHEIQLAQPDLVVKAIRAVVESVKTGANLKLPTSDVLPGQP